MSRTTRTNRAVEFYVNTRSFANTLLDTSSLPKNIPSRGDVFDNEFGVLLTLESCLNRVMYGLHRTA